MPRQHFYFLFSLTWCTKTETNVKLNITTKKNYIHISEVKMTKTQLNHLNFEVKKMLKKYNAYFKNTIVVWYWCQCNTSVLYLKIIKTTFLIHTYLCFVGSSSIRVQAVSNLCVFNMMQDELGSRAEFLLEKCFKKETEEMETTKNVNRLLLQNLLPEHVTDFFIGKDIQNQVKHAQRRHSDSTYTHSYTLLASHSTAPPRGVVIYFINISEWMDVHPTALLDHVWCIKTSVFADLLTNACLLSLVDSLV